MDDKLSVHFSTGTDTWGTPQALFEKYNEVYNFKWDFAAEHTTAKCKNYYTVEDDALTRDWYKDVTFVYPNLIPTGFLNPPYSRNNQKKFIAKAVEESSKGLIVVCVIPARTDTQLWHKYVYNKYTRAYYDGVYVDLLEGRVKFELNGKQTDPAPFPTAVVIFDKTKRMDHHPFIWKE